MTGTRRIAADERKLRLLEDEFRDRLVAALRCCAGGRWGLFGRNEHFAPPDADPLLALGEQIQRIRDKLGIAEPFTPYARLQQLRRRGGANEPGEPKLAQQWLDELAAAGCSFIPQ